MGIQPTSDFLSIVGKSAYFLSYPFYDVQMAAVRIYCAAYTSVLEILSHFHTHPEITEPTSII